MIVTRDFWEDTSMHDLNRCPYCGHPNRSGVLYCDECGHSLVDRTIETLRSGDLMTEITAPLLRPIQSDLLLADPNRQCDPFYSTSRLLIHIRDADEPLTVTPGQRMTFGRHDTRNPHHVDIDLTPYSAFKMGVSRVHATLYREVDHLLLADTGSANGTFINGMALVPHHPVPLCNADEIRLGNLIMHIYFVD
jgi:hypothetical protein